ncbi:MAG: hypothetical protein BWY95_01318 [Bacteroidetes bacterium ADurb.BinA104]|nr:MAG: hypothetical protein BWY95_01318 [Bacteroidetes bacterium ADurb.BinA104]
MTLAHGISPGKLIPTPVNYPGLSNIRNRRFYNALLLRVRNKVCNSRLDLINIRKRIGNFRYPDKTINPKLSINNRHPVACVQGHCIGLGVFRVYFDRVNNHWNGVLVEVRLSCVLKSQFRIGNVAFRERNVYQRI